jgi:hypothetical protein
VSVLGVRASRESNGFVACAELDIKPGDESMDEVVATSIERVRLLECQIRSRDCVEVEGDDGARIGDHSLHIDSINKRLGHGGGLERGVVESPDIVPDWSEISWRSFEELESHTANLLFLVVSVLNSRKEDSSLVREDEAIGLEVLITRIEHRVEHALVQEEIAHPLRDDDVNLRERHLNLLHLALKESDLVRHAIDGHDFSRLLNDGRHIHANDMLCAGLDREPATKFLSATK